MKKHRKTITIISVAVLLAISWVTIFRKKEKSIMIETSRPVIGTITKTVTATGTLQPVDTVAVGVQVSGTIKNIYVDFNSVVKKGQLLAQLDPVLLLSQQEQVIANLQAGRANLEYQSANYNRQRQLYNVGVISKADLETAVYQFHAVQQNVNSIQSQLKAA
ncbi:MAG TPA: biotin/lipoyl-binding protein, partial [Niastella sp.]|nr:biotin/lipoyl-binding protein [Niastella sp.]